MKDRIAEAMIDDAEARGVLKPGATIIEPTSDAGKNIVVLLPDTGERCLSTALFA